MKNHVSDYRKQNYFLRIFFALFLFTCIVVETHGQSEEGDSMSNPIVVGEHGDSFSFSSIKGTALFTDQYTVRSQKDIIYRFTITRPMIMTLSHCGSSYVLDTYMHLLDSSGDYIQTSDYSFGDGACSSSQQAFIQLPLNAGTYYVVSELGDENEEGSDGVIKTNIDGYSYDFNYQSAPSGYSTDLEAVGSINGAFDVSAMGGATYSIPIDVPQGVGGMQPGLALVYNSQAGNGLAGWGCNLSGISVITRAPKDIYHDGAAKGLTHMANEAYLLDGQRLIYVSGTAGQNGAIYSPESDPFTQVIVHGTDTVWFEVHASNGMKYYFGNTTSARQSYTAGSSSRINAWYLDYAEDPLGNYMDYTYQMAGFFVYPNSIIYGKNQNVTGSFQNTVTFTYESRSDSTHFVLEGVKGSMGKRLKTITCKTGNEVYRTYNLQYNNTGDASTTKFSRLISVTEKNGAGEALKPTVLNWSYLPAFSQDVSATTVTNGGSVSFDNHSFIAMDHNGDGLTDMTGFFTSGTRTVARVYLASLDTYGNVQFTANGTSNDYNVGPSDRIMAILKSLTDKDYLLTDFDGDGVSELILTEMGSRIIHCTRLEDADEGNSLYIDYRQSRSEIPLFAAEDLNNDGRGEIIILERNPNGPTPCTIVNVQDTIFLGLSFPSKPDKMFVSDYNGDGLKDILVFYGGGKSAVKGYTIFWNQGDGISSTTFSDSHKTIGTNIAYAWMIREGDFNGDGLPDFIMNASYTNQWYFALNNGNGTFTKQLACTLEIYDQGTSSDNDKFTCLVYDFDFDGKSDVVINKAMYGTTPVTHTYWMRSNGDSLNVKIHSTSNRDVDAKSSHYVLGDFNGDGQVELVNYGYNCASGTNNTNPSSSWHLYKNSNYNVNRGKITSITNGYGATTTINYASLANGGIYTKGSGSTYPIVDYTLPVHAVKTVTANGMTVNYRYGGIKAHLRGRGLIGMMSQKATNTTLNTVTESGISGINVSFYLPNETYTKTIVNGDTAKVTTQITFAPKGTTKYFAYPSSKTEKDLDGNINYTTYQYNTAYGYITEEKTRYNTNNDQMHKTIQYGNYVLAGGAYKPRLIIQTQRHADDTATFTQKKYITYDTTRGYQTQVIENYDTSLPLTTNYTYDDFGNVLTSQTTGSGITPITNIVEYDATKRFVTKTYTSPASEVQTYTYNIWGNVLTENDETNTSNILTTAHTYDNWGNRKTTSFLDSLRISYHSGWNNNNSKRFFTLIQKKGQPWVKTWYDNLGREVLTESRGPKSMIIKTAKTYNNKGQLTQEQNQQGNLTITQSYTYDIYGRVASSSSTAGQSATYGYGNRRDTVTTNGRTYIKTYDAWGNIKTSSDPASSVSYTYNSQGKPKTVTTGGATFSMTYYNTGLQHTLVDPNAGTTTYVYDAAGRMTQQTDGRGKVTTNTYDALGRLASSMCGGASGLVNYTYGTSGNEKLRLTRIQQGSYYIAYTHDSQGRVVTEKRKVPGITATLDFSYAYNPAGQVSSITYPEGVQISRQYDSYGNLEKVKYGTQNIWELIGATGRVTTTKLGGTMTSTKTLSTQGLLTGQQTVLGSNTLHNMTYVFNAATGNLSSRTGMTGATTTEGFTYDNLDRLTTVTHNGASVMDISYYANGNIDFKTGLGEYSYLATKPHALKSVDNTDGLVPSTRQSISYTNFNKVSSISELDEKANGGVYSMTFDYGPTRERWRTILNSNYSQIRIITYAGDYERIYENGVTKHLIYISGGDGLAAVYVKQNGQADKIYYVHKDHLGSIIKLTESNGTEVFRASYDAWGKQTITNNTFKFYRGYTGHEHLPEFSLINMNGRVYDPVLGRFLSPDPYVQMPDFSQNFNRYSYCFNNPFKFTDPSGEFLEWIVIGVMAYMGGMQANFAYTSANNTNPFNPGNWNWGSAHTYIGIAGGAMGGAGIAGYSIPYTQVPGMLSNGGLQAGIQVGLNGIGNLADGHNFFDNWYWSAGMGFASGAISGYNLAQAGGRNYWWGNEVQYGRTQWSFFTSELPKTSVKFNINFITATANNTCVPQSLTELERSRGGSRTELDFRESTGWTEQGVAMRNGESGNSNFLRGQGFENEIMSGDDISNALKMQGASNVGNNVTITHNEGDIRHMTTVKQIDYYQSGKVNIYGRGRTYQLNELKGLNPYYFLIK